MSEFEKEYWNNTVKWGTWRPNTVGEPPYDLTAVSARLFETLPTRGRILDLGCGWGRLTKFLGEGFPDLTIDAVDHSLALLEIASDSGAPRNVRYHFCDGRNLPRHLSTGTYDAAYSITVLQHIPGEAKWGYINQVYDLLVPDGVFVFTVAEGDIDTFMNHQIDDIEEFVLDLTMLWDEVVCEPHGLNDWTWVECHK